MCGAATLRRRQSRAQGEEMRRPLGIPILSLSLALAASPLVMSLRLPRAQRHPAPVSPGSTCPARRCSRQRASTTSPPRARSPAGTPTSATGPACTPPGRRTRRGVPGLQVDGYFPDTSTSNTTHGWSHDAQFVIRLPERVERQARDHRGAGHPQASTPPTPSSPTGCWRRATPTPRPTRATAAPPSTATARRPAGSVARVAPARDRADPGRQAGRRTALRPRAGAAPT